MLAVLLLALIVVASPSKYRRTTITAHPFIQVPAPTRFLFGLTTRCESLRWKRWRYTSGLGLGAVLRYRLKSICWHGFLTLCTLYIVVTILMQVLGRIGGFLWSLIFCVGFVEYLWSLKYSQERTFLAFTSKRSSKTNALKSFQKVKSFDSCHDYMNS